MSLKPFVLLTRILGRINFVAIRMMQSLVALALTGPWRSSLHVSVGAWSLAKVLW